MSWQLVIMLTVKIIAAVLLVLFGRDQQIAYALAGVLLGAGGVVSGIGAQTARAPKAMSDTQTAALKHAVDAMVADVAKGAIKVNIQPKPPK